MIKQLKTWFTLRNCIYLFSFIAGWPCIFFVLGWLPSYKVNYILIFIICLIYTFGKYNNALPLPIVRIICIQCITWAIYALAYTDTAYFTRIFLLLITTLILSIQYNEKDKYQFDRLYTFWITLQVFLGTIGVLLVLNGFLEPIFEFKEFDGRPGYSFGLFTTNAYNPYFPGIVRNAGYFDEPGALAFWGIYALLLNKLFLQNKYIEYSLIIGLLSTLSLAYYIQLFIYLAFFYRKLGFKSLISIAIILSAFSILASYNNEMYDNTVGRMEYNSETGTINGDNRTELIINCLDIYLDHPVWGVGATELASPEYKEIYGFLGANFFTTWASDGTIGGLITYLPLIYIFILGRRNKKMYITGLILLIGYLQRPYDGTQLLYPLMTYTMLLGCITLNHPNYRQVNRLLGT